MPLDPVLKKFIDKAVAEGRTATDIGKSISEAGWGLSHIQEAERYYGSKKKSSQSTSGTGSGESTSRGGVTTSSLGLPQDIVDFSIGQQKKYGLLSEEKQPIINPNKGYVWETTEPEEDSYGRVFNAFSEIEAKRKEIEETSASPTYRGPVNERPQYYRPTGFPTSGFGMGMGAAMGAGIPSPYDTRPALSEDDRQARIAKLKEQKKEAAQNFIKQSEISYNALLPKAKAYGEEVPDFYDFNGDPSQGIEWVTSKAKEYQKEQLSKLREDAIKEAENSNWAGRGINWFVYNFIGAADALGAAINFAGRTAVGGKPWEDDYTETELGQFAREGLETINKGADGEKFLAGYTVDEIQKGFIQNIVEGNYEAGLGLLGLEFLETLPQFAAAVAPGGVGRMLLATTSVGDAWARVANDPKYNTAEKIAYAGLLGLAEYYTEKIFSADRDAIKGMFGFVQEKGKKGLGDAMFGRLPKGIRAFVEEGFEESVVDLVTQGLDYAMAGKEFDAYQLADAALLGGTMGGGAFVLSKTPSALGRIPGLQTKIKFDSDIQRIKDILDSKDLSPEERGVLKLKLKNLLADSRMTEEQNMMFYQSYSEEDKKRTYELNREVLRLMELHKKTKTDIAKKAVTDEIKQKISEIEQIEKKYDSKKEQQVPSQVAQGKELGPVPIEGRGTEETETSRILQEIEDEERLTGEKTQALEQEQPDLQPNDFDNVTEETAPTIANTLYGYISNTAEAAFKALGTSRREAARAADSVVNVIKSLTKAGKKVNVKVFYSKASMENWLESINQEDPEAARGLYVLNKENKNEVTIGLLAPALLSNTVYHEGLHSIVPAVFGKDGIKRLFKVLMNKLSESDALGEYLRDFAGSASYRESEDQWEEFSVELASLISDGSVRVSVKKGIIDKFMDAMSEVLGIVGIDVKPSAAQLVNILNDYAQKLGAGVELGKIPEIFDTEELNEMANGDIESEPFIETEIVAPINVKRQDIVFPESGTYPVSKITKSDVKDIEAFLKEQVKLGKNFAFWYADQFGRGNYVDPYTGEEYFLDGGPSFPFDPENKKNGDVWATGYKTPMALYKEFVTGKKGKKKPDFIVQISGHPRRMMFFNKTVNKIWIERARAKYKDIDLLKKELTSISNIKSISFFVKNTTSWEQMLSDLDSNESIVINGKTKTKSDVIKKAIGFVKEINPKPLGKKGEIATSTKLYNLLVENGLHPDNFDNLRDGFFKQYDFNEGEILCIYKATDIVPNANTHGTYAHSIKGEPVLVPDAKVSAWGLMPEEVRRKRKIKTNKETGEKTLGKELQDLPKSAIQKAMAPDYPTVYPVTEDEKQIKRAAKKLGGKTPRKVMRMALEGYNEKPQAMAGQRLFNEPLKEAADIADKYYEKEFNEARPKFNGIKSVDKERAKRISDAYIEMEDNYFDPEVKKAYDAMIDETLKQFDFIVDKGYKVVINNEEPYKNSEDMITDLRDNKVMRIFSTESGFGDEPITENQRDSNPLLKDSGRKDANGIPLLNNDLFRFVHDFFGHAELGNGFGAVGEENAWNVHARMYSPLARRAMTSETRGQNSYVNFSGVNEEAFKLRDKAREERKKGNDAEADKLLGEVYEKMKFADQKVGLLPEEMAIPDGFEDTKPKVKRMALTDTFKEASAPNFITEEDRREFQSMSLSDTQDEANNELWSFVQRRNLNEEQIEEVLQSELWDEVSDSVKQNEERIEEEAYYEKNPHEKQLEDFSDKMEAYEDFDFTIERAGTGTSYVTVSKLSFDKNGRRSKEDVAQIRFANHMRAYNPKNPNIANYDVGPDYNTTVDGVIKKIVGDAKPKVKRQVTAWHGSPYDFEKFKTENIGTGEGAQAFGWGLYFTDLESVARDYAKKLSGDVYSYDGKLISKEANDYLFLADNSFGENFNENTIRDIAKVAINKIKKEYIPDLKEIAKTSTSEKQRSEMPNEVKKLEGIIKELENVISSKEIKLEENKALYKVSLHKGKTPIASSNYSVIGKFIIPKKEPGMSYEEYSRKARRGEIKILKEFNTKEEAEQWLKEEDKKAEYTWLKWSEPLSESDRKRINSQFEKEGMATHPFLEDGQPQVNSGRQAYELIGSVLYSQNGFKRNDIAKETSLFLLRAGIDGVKYPAESFARNLTVDTARGYNYVVFDENAVTIENKIKFQKISKAKNLKKDVSKVSRMSAGSFSGRMYNYLLSLTTENDQGVREIAISKAEWMNTMAPIIGANEASDMYDNVLNNNVPQDAIDTSLTSNVDKAYEDSLSKIERETKKAIFTIENLIVKLIDRQHLIKAAVLKANISRVKNLIVNKAGSSARALHFIRSWENRIYKGLNDNEATLLDKVIVLRRIKTIDDNFAQRYNDALNEYNDAMQQLSNMQAGTPAYDKLLAKAERAQKKMAEAKPPAHPEGINGITASLELARIRESIGDDAFNNINERASEYFDAFSSILDEMYRENMISEKLYEQLAGLDYQPRVFLEHMFADMDQNMMTEHRLTGPIIKRLKEGSDKEMLFNSKYLLRIYAKNAFSRIARNKIHKELAKYADTQDWISSSPRTGFSEITFYGEKGRKKGVQQSFYLKNDLYNSLNDVYKYALSPKAQNIIGMISGARLLKFFATQVNPLFVVKNIPRDFAHILFFTDFYDSSPLPVAAFRLGMDYINGIKSKITEDKWFNLYLKYGGGMEFLSTEGEESAGLGYVSNAKKTMMGKLGMKASEILSKSKEGLGYLGELSEIAPRIGIFKALVERNLREANVDIRSAAAEPIIEEAVAMVREIIDFAQGGELTKAGESVIPYLNAAFQGFRVASRYAFVSNPKQFAYKLAQLSVAVFTLALYNSSVGDDDMEDISDDIKFRNWIILTPFRDKDGNRYYRKIAKTQQLQSFAYLGEIAAEAFVASQKDREPRINDDLGEVALKAVGGYLPKDVGKLDKEIATANPFLSAIYTYKSNYDAFRDAVVSRDYAVDGKNRVLPQYEDFYNKDVPYFYKAIGQGLGVGPKRLQASTEKMITSPHSSLLVMGGYALADSFSRMFELKGPDGLTLKDQSDISKSVAERFNVDAKKIFLGVTNPETKSYEKREQIDESNMDSNTRRMFIKREADKWGQKLYEMRNQPNANTSANIDTYNKTIDSIHAELSSIYDKQGEQTAEYFRNRVFIVAKKGSDIPQEYNDLLFASDDVARAKILYMYDKSMSEQEIYDYMGSYSEAVNRNVSREQNIRIAEEYNKLKK